MKGCELQMLTTRKVLKGNMALYEGSIKNEENSAFMNKLQDLIKSPNTRLVGGSYYNGILWLSIDILGSCESSIAKIIRNVFGINDIVINGVAYPRKVTTL